MLLKLSKFFLAAAFFSVVIVMTSTFFPFIGGKYYFFRIAVELALASLILFWAFEAHDGWLSGRLKAVFRQPLVLAVSAFAAAFMLAVLFAHDPNAAFWSNYERGDGGFQMLHYYLFSLMLVLTHEREEEWRRLMKVSLVAAFLMIGYGILAAAFVQGFVGGYYNVDGQPLSPYFLGRLFHPQARFQGSLGNPAYVAPYLIFSVFYAFYLWWSSTSRRLGNALRYGGLIFALLIFFVLSQTRGAFLGLGAAGLSFFIYLLVTAPVLRKKAGAVLLGLCLLFGLLFVFRESAFMQRLPGNRFLTINLRELTAQTRFWTWGTAWQGFKERPILGWGPENFSTVFDKHFDPRHFVPGENRETWFDRAHSVFFDYFTETGLVGLLAYLAIFVVYYLKFFKTRLATSAKAEPERTHLVRALLFALPIGYLVQGLVLFDVLPIYLNLFFFFAFASYKLTHHS